MVPDRPPTISVVIACLEGRDRILRCLAALEPEGSTGAPERIVVDASTDGSAERAATVPGVRVLRRSPRTPVPFLWADGIDAAGGEVVALTIAQCVPAPDWLVRLVRQPWDRYAGVGGSFELDEEHDSSDLAIFLSRYSSWLPGSEAATDTPRVDDARGEIGGRGSGDRAIPVEDLAADNAAYRRDALLACRELWASEGFWEPFVHRKLREMGERLVLVPDLRVRFGHHGNLGEMARQRYVHGRWYATHRMRGRGRAARWLRALTAPALPAVLLSRIHRRTRGRRAPVGSVLHWLPALPALLLLLAAWSLGEMVGYVAPERTGP